MWLLYCKMQKVFCLWWASNGPLGHFLWVKIFVLITTPQEYDKLKWMYTRAFQRFCSWIQNSFLKCKFLCRYFLRILLIDLELPTLKNGFLWSCFLKILLIDFWIATNLKTGSAKKYYWKILFIDSKISATEMINLRVH